jgi:anaerobic ribonucleoside-triphosphate reductase activating protein
MVNEYNDPGCRQAGALCLAGFLARSAVNGPGIRAVVWVQGCPHRCEGCFNAAFQPFSSQNTITAGELAGRILAVPDIDGVTFSGGEPFAQAGALARTGEQLRAAGLSVVTYTGYTIGQLAAGADPAWPALLAVTDLLIAGPYIASRACPGPLRGSENQQVVALGSRLAAAAQPCRGEKGKGLAEFTIAPDGTITASGFPDHSIRYGLAARCRGS